MQSKKNSIQVYVFNTLRTLKSRVFIVMASIFSILNIIVVASLSNMVASYSIAPSTMLILLPNSIGIIFIFIINLYTMITMYIEDKKNGIHGLEKRMGVSNWMIYFTRILSNKTIIYMWIIFSFISFLIFSSIFAGPYKDFVIENWSLGLFTQVIFDLLITALISLMLIFKSIKFTSILISFISVFFVLFPIIGTVQFVLVNPSKLDGTKELTNIALLDDYKKILEKKNSFIYELYEEYKNDPEDVVNVIDTNGDEESFDLEFLYRFGMIKNYNDIFHAIGEKHSMELDVKTIKESAFKNSLIYKFLNYMESKIQNNGKIDNTFFRGKSKSVWDGSGQLKYILDLIAKEKNNLKNSLGINESSINELIDKINYEFNFGGYNSMPDTFIFTQTTYETDTTELWQYRGGSAGLQLLQKYLMYIFRGMNSVTKNTIYTGSQVVEFNESYFFWKNAIRKMFFSNPLTHLITTSLHSNNNELLYEKIFSDSRSIMPLPSSTVIKPSFILVSEASKDEEATYKLSEINIETDPVKAWIIYLSWTLMAIILYTLGSLGYLRRMKV